MTHTWERPFNQGARLTFWLLLACVVAAVVWAALAKVQVYALTRGVLEPKGKMLVLAAPAAGRIVAVNAELWGEVTPGQALFELDAVGSDKAQSELQLAAKRAQLEEAQRSLALSQETLAQAERVYAQKATLWQAQAIPKNELLEAEEALAQAREALGQAQARLSATDLEGQQLEHDLKVGISSPEAGHVATLNVRHVGKVVSYGETLAEVLPQDVPLVFKAYARESDRAKIEAGARAEIAWNSFPRQKYGVTSGKVLGISPTSTDQDGQMVYEVEIGLNTLTINSSSKQLPILPGMAGEARIISARQSALSLLWDWLRGANPWE